jgi:glutamate racemase
MSHATPPTILVFDSGVGGLTVFREIKAALPGAKYVYIADDAGFPYGDKPESVLIARIVDVVGAAIAEHRPDLIVVACNTASTVALASLRARFSVPFVGTVPAIKPACARSKTRRITVLGTKATVSLEYTRALIREFSAGCEIDLVGSSHLATYAEAELAGNPVTDGAIKAEIAACFVDAGGRRTDTVVLACTHYPLLTARYRTVAPWPVDWLDPAPAIARRVVDLIGAQPQSETPIAPRMIFTSGRTPPPHLAAALKTFGF